MAKLRAEMMAIASFFITRLAAWLGFMSYLAGITVTLQIAFMATFQHILTFTQA
jgi:hypothetical protein